ncbi:MAG: phospholipase D-like domain-containing protein [Clostridiales bacterium]|nr:phospholipase D-like domain-containing protein [Clostridiales bacterium]
MRVTNDITVLNDDTPMSLCAESTKSIKLCAPYVKTEVFSDLLNNKQKTVPADLITKINLRNYHNNSSDLEAIQRTLENGGCVYNCSNLHAKVYIFDETKCIITSSNLTVSGLKRNAECGIFTDESAAVDSALTFYNYIKSRDDVGRITEREIKKISDLLSRIPPIPRISYPKLDLPVSTDTNVTAISSGLSGWKRDVFLSLGQFEELFTSNEISLMAAQLKEKYPHNNHREAKIRQILQQLRDLGLVEFSSPGIYRKLWI